MGDLILAKPSEIWTNQDYYITPHFTVKEALYLHQWGRLATPKDGLTTEIQLQIAALFGKMELVREYLCLTLKRDVRIVVSDTYRPKAYNCLQSIGGVVNSAHIYGMACDWIPEGFETGVECDQIRAIIVPKLAEWGLRCERRPGSDWLHTDTRNPGLTGYYFIP